MAYTELSTGKEHDILGTEKCAVWPACGAGRGVEDKR